MLTAFVGCAGVGKNTIIKELIGRYPEVYEIFPTLTTRAMRPGEVEGNPYHYVSKEEFKRLIDEGEIYEWQMIHDGNYYGGSRQVLRKHLAGGKQLIKDIDVLGARTYKQKLGDITKILSVFLYVEDLNELLERMRGRGDSEDDIKKRAERFPMEMAESVDCDYLVNNEDVGDTADAVDCLLRNEESLGGLYRPAQGALPGEEEINAAARALREGAKLSAELVFNGRELLITSGAAAYAAALREKRFVQKKIRCRTDRSLEPCELSLEAWRSVCEG